LWNSIIRDSISGEKGEEGCRMRVLERFILDVPYLFLKKIPYAWLGAVFFWSQPPVLSGILLVIVLAGLGMMAWQERTWETKIIREFSSGEGKAIIDHPHAARSFQIRNLVLVLVGSGLLGWLLNGRFELSGLQWGLLLAGCMLLYKDTLLFGAGVTYIITDQGIGIRYIPGHVDYRLFFKFHEIWRAELTKVTDRMPRRWDVLTPQRRPQEGVLLYAARREGFSKQIRSEVLLGPTDTGKFLRELTGRLAMTGK
jgi:hypothetical protein